MSKPIARVVLFALISLVLIAATSVGVRSWLSSASPLTGSHAVNGLYTNFNHQRSTVTELQSLQAQGGTYAQPAAGTHQGGCHSNGQASPQD